MMRMKIDRVKLCLILLSLIVFMLLFREQITEFIGMIYEVIYAVRKGGR